MDPGALIFLGLFAVAALLLVLSLCQAARRGDDAQEEALREVQLRQLLK